MDDKIKKIILQGTGSVFSILMSGEDPTGNWLDDVLSLEIENETGSSLNINSELLKAFGLPIFYTWCGLYHKNDKCPYVDEFEDGLYDERCPYLTEDGICKPPLYEYKITIEAKLLKNVE